MALARQIVAYLAAGAVHGVVSSPGVAIPTQQVAPGVMMPVISIGTGGTEISKSTSIVHDWLELGGRGIDTAWIYKDQRQVAQAIADFGINRNELFITTKIPGCVDAKQFVDADLQQLNTTYVDLLLIHFPGGGDCKKTWAALEDYHSRGVARAIGVSNFKRSDLEPLVAVAKVVPAVNQIQHNVLEHDDDTISCCQVHGITVEAYSPLGRDSGSIPKNPTIQQIATAHNVSTYQVAMRWILQHGNILTFQSSSEAHQQDDADVFGFQLTAGEMAQLDTLAPPPTMDVVV